MPDRPTRYFVEVVNRTKLEAALLDLWTFNIDDCLDYIDCETLAVARKVAKRRKPVGGIRRRRNIRANGDYDSEAVE